MRVEKISLFKKKLNFTFFWQNSHFVCLLVIIFSNSCTLNISSESISDKLAVVSNNIGGCLADLVGDNEIGVPSLEDKLGDKEDEEPNLIPTVISP